MTANTFDGRFEILGEPKKGGMSVVYKVKELSSGSIYALKVCKDSTDKSLKASFEAEHKALSNLSHANIVKSMEIGISSERELFLLLEWMPTTLHEAIPRSGRTFWAQYYVDVGKPLLDALRYAHGRRVAHRDLKPSNVLLDEKGTPRVADFGIARQMDKLPHEPTLRGAGSAPYTPPEPDDGIHSFGRDCYSWAVITLSCLSGRLFENLAEVMRALEALDAKHAPLQQLKMALSLDPKLRYRSASELAADVEGFERERLHARGESIPIALTFTRNSLEKCLSALVANDVDDGRSRVLSDLNEVCGIDILSQEPLTLALIGATCVVEGEIYPSGPDQVVVSRINVLSLSAAERRRENSASVPFVRIVDRVSSPEEMRRSLSRVLSFVESELARKEEERVNAAKEKFFDALAAYIREKERFYRDNSESIHYSHFRKDGAHCIALLEKEVPPESLGESVIVELPNSRPVIFDVLDVNLDQVTLQHKVGQLDYVPQSGYLKNNRTAELMALGKQRAAVEMVRSGMAVSAQLGDLLRSPETTIGPERSGLPPVKGLSLDKQSVLEKALGIVHFLVVQGPPGTGKTTLIAELISQYLSRFPERRVLLSSQTHVALDHVITKLKAKGLGQDIVRIAKSQERKVDPQAADLLLGRKVEEWSRRAEDRSRKFVDEFAARFNLNSKDLRVGILGNERLRRVARVQQIDHELAALRAKQEKLDDDRKRRIQAVEPVDVDALVTETSTVVDQLRALEEERAQHTDADRRVQTLLATLGESGKRLSEAVDDDVGKTIESLLPDSEQGRLLRAVVELQHRWLERLGASQDFFGAVLREARVVAGTCVGLAGVQAIYEDEYDLCIVDEASKATATETLIPMSRGRTWMLVGDPKQLPPFKDTGVLIKVEGFSEDETNRTLLDYLLEKLPKASRESLSEQHRMVKSIGDLVSHCFYPEGLTSTRKDHERSESSKRVFAKPVTWVSTHPGRANEKKVVGGSFKNAAEAHIICALIRELNAAHRGRSKRMTVAVIAGYAAQVLLMKELIGAISGGLPKLTVECNTVDAFQGRDADICFYSVTRSNPEYNLGFQRQKPRLNVALSRARNALVIVGDLSFCKGCQGENPFPPVIEYIEEHPDSCEIRRNARR